MTYQDNKLNKLWKWRI